MTRLVRAPLRDRPRAAPAWRALRPVEPVSAELPSEPSLAREGFSLATMPIEAIEAPTRPTLRLVTEGDTSVAAALTEPTAPTQAPALALPTSTTPPPTLAAEVATPVPPAAFATAQADPVLPLPDRTAHELALGRSLDHVAVRAGPATRTALDTLGADGATSGGDVFVRELPQPGSVENQQPARAVLAHEVVHAAAPSPSPTQADVEAAAEPAAAALAEAATSFHQPVATPEPAPQPEPEPAPQPAPLDRAAVPRAAPAVGAVALRRSATALPPQPSAPAVEGDPAAALAARTQPRGGAAPAREGAATPAAPTVRARRGSEATTSAAAAPPVGGALGEAAAATATPAAAGSSATAAPGAAGVANVAAAFVAAPPSQKALLADGLGEQLSQQAEQAAATGTESLPTLAATMSGAAEMPAVDGAALQPETVAPVDLTPAAPAPSAEAAVPAAPESAAFTENDGLSSWFRGLFGGSPAANASDIGDAIANVQTVDSSVATSPGPAPTVPLSGATDPALIDAQRSSGAASAQAGQAAAHAAIVEGPGPEAVQPLALEQPTEIAELAQAPLEAQPAVEGIEQFKAAEMPEDVQAAFDAQNGGAMQASLAGAEQQVGDAVATRDAGWQSQVETAQQANAELVDSAEQEQNAAVDAQRDRIQSEREATLEQQAAGVADLHTQADSLQAEQQGEIDARVAADETQIDQRYAEAEQQAEAEVADGERRAEAEKEAAQSDAENESWWDQAASFISEAVSALVDAVSAIIDSVRSAVGAIIDAVRDAAVGLIEAACEFIQAAIAVYGELLKGLVDGLLGELFPELAAALNGFIDAAVGLAQAAIRAAADALVAGVNALAEAAHAGLDSILDAFQGALNFASSLINAALTGDWSEVLRLLLEAALQLAGIPPEAFYAFVGRAQETFSIIVNDPLGFLGNLFGALSLGFDYFVDGIWEHLQQGFFEWVVGPLGELGITLPQTWDIWSILGIVLQVLGLTQQGIRAVIVEELGETAGAIFDFVWRYVDALITGGWQGLWEQIQNDLSTLWGMVVDGLKDWLISTIVTQGTLKLVSMLDPTGVSQIVQVLVTCWQIYTFLRDNMGRIQSMITAIVTTIDEIAHGNKEPSAHKVDDALGRLIPIAISLLANLLGLGGITGRVREVIENIRETVRNAIKQLIRRVRGLFSGGGNTAADPAQPGEDGAEDGDTITEQVHLGSETHTLRIGLATGQVTMASVEGPLTDKFRAAREKLEEYDGTQEEAEAAAALTRMEALLNQMLTVLRAGGEVDRARLRELSRLTKQALDGYGDQFHVTDIVDGLPRFGPVKVEAHPAGRSSSRQPDGSSRESHHVPSKEVAQALAREMADAATALSRRGTPAARAAATQLRDRVRGITGNPEGDGLSAISLHRVTHQNAGGVAVHSAAMREELEAEIARIDEETGRETLAIRNRVGRETATNPSGDTIDAWVGEVADQLDRQQATLAEKAAAGHVLTSARGAVALQNRNAEAEGRQAEEQRVNHIASAAFESALTHGEAGVVAALRHSVIDGPQATHQAEVDKLDGLARTTWRSRGILP